MITRVVVLVALALPLHGCGVYYTLSVENQTNEPIEVELRDVAHRLSSTVAPNGSFEYTMKDGWRSSGGEFVRIHGLGHPPDARSLNFVFRPGELLFPRTARIVVESENGEIIGRCFGAARMR